jgi:Ca2+-binding EF-hand superfamily protein
LRPSSPGGRASPRARPHFSRGHDALKSFFAATVITAFTIGLAAPASAQFMGGGNPMEAFEGADTNHDGVVTRAEFLAARSARFDTMDRNGDGFISPDDFGMILKLRPQAAQKLDAFIKQADSNGDGKVSRTELANAPTPIFDMADANHDGRVDKAELAAARERLQGMRRQ